MIRLLLLILTSLPLIAADSTAAFENANRLYEKGDYAGAAAAYRSIMSVEQESAALWFNLGNAHFKSGRPGPAIAAFRKAQSLAPRDPDIRANLRFARESVPGNNIRSGAVDRFMRILTTGEAATISTLLLWLWAALLIVGQLRRNLKPALATWVTAAGVLAITFSIYYWTLATYQRANRTVVVTATGNTPVRFGPLEESQASFTVREGNELRILGAKGDWIQVSDAGSRVGWIHSRNIQQAPF